MWKIKNHRVFGLILHIYLRAIIFAQILLYFLNFRKFLIKKKNSTYFRTYTRAHTHAHEASEFSSNAFDVYTV